MGKGNGGKGDDTAKQFSAALELVLGRFSSQDMPNERVVGLLEDLRTAVKPPPVASNPGKEHSDCLKKVVAVAKQLADKSSKRDSTYAEAAKLDGEIDDLRKQNAEAQQALELAAAVHLKPGDAGMGVAEDKPALEVMMSLDDKVIAAATRSKAALIEKAKPAYQAIKPGGKGNRFSPLAAGNSGEEEVVEGADDEVVVEDTTQEQQKIDKTLLEYHAASAKAAELATQLLSGDPEEAHAAAGSGGSCG